MHFPQEFIIRREVQAIQHFGQNRLESISEGEIILAEGRSVYSRMIEAVRQERRYLIFERDLRERADPTAGIEDDDATEPTWTCTSPLGGNSPTKVQQVRAVMWRDNLPASATEWFPLQNGEVVQALDKLIPADGGRFMVTWEEREVEITNEPLGWSGKQDEAASLGTNAASRTVTASR